MGKKRFEDVDPSRTRFLEYRATAARCAKGGRAAIRCIGCALHESGGFQSLNQTRHCGRPDAFGFR